MRLNINALICIFAFVFIMRTIKEIEDTIHIKAPSVAQIADYFKDSLEDNYEHLASVYVDVYADEQETGE